MAPQPADRARYEAEQAAFVRSLISGDGFPEGLDEAKAAAASRSLWRKRMRAVAAAWPALALIDAFEARFEAYARAVAPPAVGHGLTDGLQFARTLPRAELTDDVRVELLLARAVVVVSRRGERFRDRRGGGLRRGERFRDRRSGGLRRGGGFRDRRGLFLGALSLRRPRRILLVLRAPVAGRRQLVLSLEPPRPRP